MSLTGSLLDHPFFFFLFVALTGRKAVVKGASLEKNERFASLDEKNFHEANSYFKNVLCFFR